MKKQYYWEGITMHGQYETGLIQTNSKKSATQNLYRKKILVLKIRPIYSIKNKKISKKSLYELLERLSQLLLAGIPMTESLHLLKTNQPKKTNYAFINNLQNSLAQGLSFSQAIELEKISKTSVLQQSLKTGEKNGQLPTVLKEYCHQKIKMMQWKKKLFNSLRYPVFVLLTTLLILYSLLNFSLPQMQSLFSDMNNQLPFLTAKLMTISINFKTYLKATAILFSMTIPPILLLLKNKRIKKHTHSLYLKIPFYKQYQILQWIFSLQLCLNSGMPLVEALESNKTITENLCMQHYLKNLIEQIRQGKSFQSTLKKTSLLSKEQLILIGIGEKTNQLSKIFLSLYNQTQTELTQSLQNFIQMLEPILLLILALLIGTIVIAMYLPIFSLGKTL